MALTKRIVGLAIVGVAATLLAVLLPARQPAPPILSTLAPFVLVDAQGHPFDAAAQLRGRVWISNIIFTRCPTVCPLFTRKMLDLQRRTESLGDQLKLVSFTADPEHDTPAVLAGYAASQKASPDRWHFVTGARSALEEVLVRGLKLPMGAPEGDQLLPLAHSGHFTLVDRQLRIRGYYASSDPASLDALVRDATLLAHEP